MKRILFLLLLLWSGIAKSQSCETFDTVRTNAASLITYNSARINGSITHTGGAPISYILKYVRTGQVDTASSSAATPLRNLTGLQPSTEYTYYYTSVCPSSTVSQTVGAYTFTTLANTVNYTPMAAMGYQFKYLKADSGLMAPRRDTTIGRAPDYGGQIVWKPEDSTFYGYNGEYWHPLAIDSAGIITLLNDKVDSVTVAGDSLWYWKQGVSYGYILPTQSNEWDLTGNSGTTAGTNFLGTTDNVGLMFKTNNVQSGYIDYSSNSTSLGYQSLLVNAAGDNSAFGYQALTANSAGSENAAFGASALPANDDGNENSAFGASALQSNVSGSANSAFGHNALSTITGSNNIGIGTDAGKNFTSESNRLFINSIAKASKLLDSTESIIYGAMDATASNQRLYLNSRVYVPYMASGVGTKAVRIDPSTGLLTYADTTTGGGGIYGGSGTLPSDVTVDGNGQTITFNNLVEFAITADAGTGSSYFGITEAAVTINPDLGILYIDTLNYQSNADDSMMVWRPSTGRVGMRAIPSGGSGANTALSNLASVAINTSLLPGVSDNIDLGSTTFQWRNLFLGEGQKVDWDNGDVTMTQSGNNLTVAGGALIVTNAEQTPASFTSTFAGNMQVNWNSTTGNNVNFVFQDAGTARWYVGNNSATGSDRLHILNASAAEAVTVLQGLQVGINNTAPTARLHIGAGAATASYAPLKFTTGTNNTTAEAGAMEYTTPQLFFTNGRAVRQELFQGQQSRVTVQYDNATTTLGNVTGLTANVAASGTYRFEAKLYTTSDVAGGIKVAIGGTATATAIRYEGLTTDAGLTTQGRATALGTAVGAVTAVTAAYVVITGTITVNGAGTLTVQAAANAATGTTSVLTGSTFVITEML